MSRQLLPIKMVTPSKSKSATANQPGMESIYLPGIPVNTRRHPFVQVLRSLRSVSMGAYARKMTPVIASCRGRELTVNFLSNQRTFPTITTMASATLPTIRIFVPSEMNTRDNLFTSVSMVGSVTIGFRETIPILDALVRTDSPDPIVR